MKHYDQHQHWLLVFSTCFKFNKISNLAETDKTIFPLKIRIGRYLLFTIMGTTKYCLKCKVFNTYLNLIVFFGRCAYFRNFFYFSILIVIYFFKHIYKYAKLTLINQVMIMDTH